MKGLGIYIYRISFILLMLCALAGCAKLWEDGLSEDRIELKGVVNSAVLSVKSGSEGPVYSDEDTDLEIGMARADGNGAWGAMLAATLKRDNNSSTADPIDFTDTYQSYNDNQTQVHFASWYPRGTLDKGTVEYSIDGKTDVMYGSVVSGTQSSGFPTITFNHALVKFKVWAYALMPDGAQVTYNPNEVWGKLNELTVKDVNKTYTISLPSTPGGNYSFIFSSESDMSISLPFGDGTSLPEVFPEGFDNKVAVAEFMIPAPEVLGLVISTEKHQEGKEISIEKKFQPGHHYDIVLRFSDHGLINADVTVGSWVDGTDITVNQIDGEVYYSLSERETANCYVVSSANYNYSFDTTIKGNGVRGLVDVSSANIDAKYVKLIWKDSDLDFELKNTNNLLYDGKALFRVIGNPNDSSDKSLKTEGNALIGVYAANDPEMKTPLWTWHIWVCDRPQMQSYKNGFNVQDRDLGAVASNPFDAGVTNAHMDGLYYQWGRPTPLPLGRNVDFKIKQNKTDDHPSVADRIQHPDQLYTTKIDPTLDNRPSLWGWRSESEEYFKTIYDPCPPGYRVPSKRLWQELQLEGNAHIGHSKVDGGPVNNHSVHFTADNYYAVFYPVSGYYYNEHDRELSLEGYYPQTSSVSLSGDEAGAAFMWAATYDSNQENPFSLKYSVVEKGGNVEVGTYSVSSDVIHSYYALPVRCISRRSSPHVEDLSAFQTANSYIVSQPGYFKIKADVRGNGVDNLVSPGSSDFIDISEGLSAEIPEIVNVEYLWWQEEGGAEATGDTPEIPLILDDDGLVKDGYVMFHIDNYKKGNLILAGYDESGTEILWTWHIWLTDTPKQEKSNDFVVMDRFLGATFAPASFDAEVSEDDFKKSCGFYYQWGRKDPFTPDTWYRYDKLSQQWTEKTGVERSTSEFNSKTIPNSILLPTTYHSASEALPTLPRGSSLTQLSNIDNLYNEASNQCFYVMRIEASRPALWGYSSASGLGKTTTKTMYDPCPPGYTVAFYTIWTNGGGSKYYTYLDGGYYTYNFNASDPNFNQTIIKRDNIVTKTGYGIYLNTDDKFDNSWYPFAGYLGSGGELHNRAPSVNSSSVEGRVQTSVPAGRGGRTLYYDENGAGQAVSGDYKGIPSSFALPVRCQKQ